MGEYNLTFEEAIKKCLNDEGFIRGSDFTKGIYVTNKKDVLVLMDGSDHTELNDLMISKGLFNQKYKIFSVANKKNLELE